MTNVTIGTGLSNIGNQAFYNCTSLSGITIPSGVTNIASEAFRRCISLSAFTVDASNSVYSSIGGVLFNKSQSTLVEYPGGLTGSYTIPFGVTSIWNYAFADCTGLTAVTIPNTVTNIGDYAFYNCTGLPSVIIPNGVTSIGIDVFAGCTGLINVTIPNGVTIIWHYAFARCTSLTSVAIPASVKNLWWGVFAYCTNLASVYFQGNPPTLGDSRVFDGDTNATVYYLPGTKGWGTTFGGRPTVCWNPTAQGLGTDATGFGFDITGSSNLVIVVEACTNLANPVWEPVSTNTLTGGVSTYSDPAWTNYLARFYRFRAP